MPACLAALVAVAIASVWVAVTSCRPDREPEVGVGDPAVPRDRPRSERVARRGDGRDLAQCGDGLLDGGLALAGPQGRTGGRREHHPAGGGVRVGPGDPLGHELGSLLRLGPGDRELGGEAALEAHREPTEEGEGEQPAHQDGAATTDGEGTEAVQEVSHGRTLEQNCMFLQLHKTMHVLVRSGRALT
jgi:hypothetical protein